MATRWPAWLLVVVAAGSGCSIYYPRPVTFRVRDGDTGQPIESAWVDTSHRVMFDFGVVFASIGPRQGATDADGKLTLLVDARHPTFSLRASSADYRETQEDPRLPRECPRWQRLMRGRGILSRDDYDVRLFHRGDDPTAEVTIPDGYRGVVVVRFPDDGGPPTGGQRHFTYTSPSGHRIDIPHSALFENCHNYGCIRVRYGSGASFPTVVREGATGRRRLPGDDVEDDALAFRFITVWSHQAWIYVLGTDAEADAVRRAVNSAGRWNESALNRIVGAP